MIVLKTNNLTGETTAVEIDVEESEPYGFVELVVTGPTPEQRIADMEAEIARLKSELNVQ